MEENPAPSRADNGIRNSLVALLSLALIVGGVWAYLRMLPAKPLTESLAPIASTVRLDVKLVDAESKPLENSIFAVKATATSSTSVSGSSSSASEPTSQTTSPTRVETLNFTPRRVAVSFYPIDGKRVFAWLDQNPKAQLFLDSPLVQGTLQPLFDALRIRAEDYSLEGIRGQFLRTFLQEMLTADAALHFDPQEGARGLILSFNRDEAPLTSRALPLLLDRVVRTQWNVTGLASPIWEAIIGKEKLFVHESKERVFFSRSLRGLLNALQEKLSGLTTSGTSPESLRVVIRSDAFVENLLPLFVGTKSKLQNAAALPMETTPMGTMGSAWPVVLDLGLDGASPLSARLRTPGAQIFSTFTPQIEPAVLSAVPGDAFAFLITSFQLPKGLSQDVWAKLASTDGPSDGPSNGLALPVTNKATNKSSGAFAVVWDLNQTENRMSELGIAISAPVDPQPGDLTVTDYARDPSLAATCANGSVWLLSSTANLLTRMREACDGTSKSLNDQNRFGDIISAGNQIFIGAQPHFGLEQVFQAGLPNLEPPAANVKEASWKSDYRLAVQNLKQTVEQQLAEVPAVFFAGKVDPATGANLGAFSR